MSVLHARHFLDISTSDLLFGASGFSNRENGDTKIECLEADIGHGALVTFSVRSAWDLLLGVLDLPAGSEVIMSAVTIPDMPRIAEAHGLTVIPIDLDPATMMPRMDLYRDAFGPRTRLVLLAHLLGGSFDLTPYADIADEKRVPLIEDCAQSFDGPHSWGSARAMVSLFSFGSIKTSTSLGAAVAAVRDADVFDCMRRVHATRPLQKCDRFARKATRYLAVQGFRSPILYGAVATVAAHSRGGLDGFISRTVKGFPASSCDELLLKLRQRPSPAQVALLRRRMERFDSRRIEARAERGEYLRHELANAGLVLGKDQANRTHWLFAISVDEPHELIARLRAAGFDATQAASTICTISAPPDRTMFDPVMIRDAMSRAVFLPAYPEMQEREADRLIDTILMGQARRSLSSSSSGNSNLDVSPLPLIEPQHAQDASRDVPRKNCEPDIDGIERADLLDDEARAEGNHDL
jgi:perosamine synthetase